MTSSRIHFLTTGAFRLDGGGMFGLIPKTMWSKWTEDDADNRIALATRSLLVESRDGLVLVEAGCGDKWSTRERELYELEQRTAVDALAEHGIDPRDIGHVVLTHLHFDHAAGLTRDGGAGAVSVFTNARIHVQRQEWLDALANKSTMTKTYFWSHLGPPKRARRRCGQMLACPRFGGLRFGALPRRRVSHDAPRPSCRKPWL